MKTVLLSMTLMAFQLVLANSCNAQNEDSKPELDAMRNAISKTIADVMRLHDVPAVSVCILQGGEAFYINHGTFNRQSKKEVDEKSIYQIASLSKTFAGLVAHELVRNESLKPDRPITDYLPNTIDKATRQKLQPISVFDLICHRSGLPRDTLNPKSRQNGTYVNYDYSETDLLQDLKGMKLAFKPGEAFMYSNFGYSLLAYVCERAGGKSYEQLVQEHATEKIRMLDTGFRLNEKQKRRLVTPYDHNNPLVARKPASIGKLGPPTSLYCTTSDLASMMKCQMLEYQQFQKTGTVTSLILSEPAKEAWQGTGIKYGYGFFDWGDGTLGHSGGMDGYGSEFTFDPKENIGFILLTSSCAPWTQRLTGAVIKALRIGQTNSLAELVAIETIIAKFEKQGPDAALIVYQQFRSQKPTPLGEDARVTLVNLARQQGMSEAAKMFVADAVADFPQSQRLQALAASFDDK